MAYSAIPHPQFRLRNDLYCVGWGVKLYSLTHSLTPPQRQTGDKQKNKTVDARAPSERPCLGNRTSCILLDTLDSVSTLLGIHTRLIELPTSKSFSATSRKQIAARACVRGRSAADDEFCCCCRENARCFVTVAADECNWRCGRRN